MFMVKKLNEYNCSDYQNNVRNLLNESFFTPPDLKAVLKFLKKLNQCVDELSDFDTNKWLNREQVLPILDDSREYLSNMFKYYRLLIQGW